MRISSELHMSWNARCIWSLHRSAHFAFTVEFSRVSFETTWRHETVRCSRICTWADVMHCVSFRLRFGSLQSAAPITACCLLCKEIGVGFQVLSEDSVRTDCRLLRLVCISKDMETPLWHRILDIVNAMFMGMAVQVSAVCACGQLAEHLVFVVSCRALDFDPNSLSLLFVD